MVVSLVEKGECTLNASLHGLGQSRCRQAGSDDETILWGQRRPVFFLRSARAFCRFARSCAVIRFDRGMKSDRNDFIRCPGRGTAGLRLGQSSPFVAGRLLF
jgi:hypothetical protein